MAGLQDELKVAGSMLQSMAKADNVQLHCPTPYLDLEKLFIKAKDDQVCEASVKEMFVAKPTTCQ